jgi:hypothetical protein
MHVMTTNLLLRGLLQWTVESLPAFHQLLQLFEWVPSWSYQHLWLFCSMSRVLPPALILFSLYFSFNTCSNADYIFFTNEMDFILYKVFAIIIISLQSRLRSKKVNEWMNKMPIQKKLIGTAIVTIQENNELLIPVMTGSIPHCRINSLVSSSFYYGDRRHHCSCLDQCGIKSINVRHDGC